MQVLKVNGCISIFTRRDKRPEKQVLSKKEKDRVGRGGGGGTMAAGGASPPVPRCQGMVAGIKEFDISAESTFSANRYRRKNVP